MSLNGSKITVIVGAQWGDEGKGKITDYFAGESDYVVRYHGGNNAGHTVIVNGSTFKLHLIPSGVLYDHPVSVIGNGVVVDPDALLNELQYLNNKFSKFIRRTFQPIFDQHSSWSEIIVGVYLIILKSDLYLSVIFKPKPGISSFKSINPCSGLGSPSKI